MTRLDLLAQVKEVMAEYKSNATYTSPIDVEKNNLDMFLYTTEHFRYSLLDNQNRVIDTITHEGTIDKCSVYPREIAKNAILQDAKGVMLMHNHPACDTTPSPADINTTENIINALKLFDIEVTDHIIFSGNTTTSIRSTHSRIF